ncbi:hypothetical protein DJ64_24780 [Streptomyces griseorubens]|uniref:Uncharacterized protein n=1 Tax=Streptomyces griseorubens TaxID=66897 RepID=A0ABR4SRX8_9ACTN|nr:hypothetical protein DJ64_24780 [Streptomyces griseorubens]
MADAAYTDPAITAENTRRSVQEAAAAAQDVQPLALFAPQGVPLRGCQPLQLRPMVCLQLLRPSRVSFQAARQGEAGAQRHSDGHLRRAAVLVLFRRRRTPRLFFPC